MIFFTNKLVKHKVTANTCQHTEPAESCDFEISADLGSRCSALFFVFKDITEKIADLI